MLIGILKEIKNHKYRVAVTPAGVRQLVDGGQCCGGAKSPGGCQPGRACQVH